MNRQLRLCVAVFAAHLAAGTAGAASTFTVTSLGNVYRVHRDADDSEHGVTGGDGQTYRFDKAPVAYDPAGPYQLQHDSSTGHDQFVTASGVSTSYTVARNDNWSIGYSVLDGPGLGGQLSEGSVNGSYWSLAGNKSPVMDVNAAGEVVGAAMSFAAGAPASQYATFSLDKMTGHPGANYFSDATNPDNLNNAIPADLGIYLTSAVKVDDLGDIVAEGLVDGRPEYFLLTVGDPVPTPEPSTLMILVGGLMALGARRLRRARAEG